MKSPIRSFIIWVIVLTLTNSLESQIIHDIRQYTIENGLPERVVNHVIRDSFGFFYIVDEQSIRRYDGQQFVDVDIQNLKSKKVKSHEIKKLFKHKNGNIYIRTKSINSVFYIRPGDKYVSSIPLNDEYEIIVDEKLIYGVHKSNEGYQLFEFSEGLLSNNFLCTTSSIPEIVIQNNGVYYIQNYDNEILVLESNRLRKIERKGKLIRRGDEVLLASNTGFYSLKGNEVNLLSKLPMDSLECKFLSMDEKGNIIAPYTHIPRFTEALWIFTNKNKLVSCDSILLKNEVFKDIYADDVFHQWIEVGYSGLHVFSFVRDGIRNYNNVPLNGLTFGFIVSGIVSNDNGDLFYLKEASKLYYKKFDERVASRWFVEESKEFRQNGKLRYDSKKKVLYSYSYTYENKSILYQIDPVSQTWKKRIIPYKLNNLRVINDRLYLMGYHKDTTQGVLSSYDFETDLYEEILLVNDAENHRLHELVYLEEMEEFILGTQEGLVVLDHNFEEKERLDRYQTDLSKNLEFDYIRAVHEYNNYLIIGSLGGGIYILDKYSKKIVEQFSQEEGLTNNKAIAMVNDNLGNCWIATWNGLNVLNKELELIGKYYEHHGLADREFNTGAVAKDERGLLYFGSINGVVSVDPKILLNWDDKTGCYFKEIKVFKSNQVELVDHIDQNDDIDSVLINLEKPNYYKFPFEEVTPEAFCSDDGVTIRTWTDKISISNIRKGQHSLTVNCPNSKFSQGLGIHVSKSYTRLWQGLLFVLSVLLVSYAFIRNNRIKQDRQSKIDRKISELQLSALQAQMNPHFIFNALGAIQFFIQSHDTDKADEYLSDFAMLMRKILEASKSKYITIEQEIEILRLYIRLENIRYEQSFDYSISTDPELDLDYTIPPMILQPLIENAINHGIVHLKERKGELQLRFFLEGEVLICEIDDNGIGRKKAKEMRSIKVHKSRGMEIINDRIETINNMGNVKAELSVTDKYDSKNESVGTKVVLKIES